MEHVFHSQGRGHIHCVFVPSDQTRKEKEQRPAPCPTPAETVRADKTLVLVRVCRVNRIQIGG